MLSLKSVHSLAKKTTINFSPSAHSLLFILLIFCFPSNNIKAQLTGDYRSNTATMNWSTAASWQKFNGSTWITSTDYPGQNTCAGCAVTIQNGHIVTLNISPANSIGTLVIGGGTNGTLTLGAFALTVAGNLTLNTGATLTLASGTFTVGESSAIAGTVTDASNIGVNTFTGLVTKTAGTWTSTAVTTASNMIFSGGFTNTAGAFSAGAATIADNQTLTGTVNMSFASGLTILGNGDLSIAGTTTAGVSFAGTAINYNVRNLSITGLLTVSTTGNLTVTGTTSITGTGAFTDNNNAGITSFTGLVTHYSTGNWNSTAVTNAANMVFSSGFTNTLGAFSAGAATIADNQTLTGTVNMSFASGLTILGNGDLNIAGTATTGVVFAGTSINYSVRNLALTGRLTVNTTGNLTVSGNTSITGAGAFVDNNNAGITSFTGLVTHNSTGVWSTPAVTTAANMVFKAGFTNAAGAFTAGGASISNGQTLDGTIVMIFNNPLSIGGAGNINIAGTGGVRFAGTAMNYVIPGNLTLTGTLLVSTTGNFTVTGTTSIIGAGDFTDNNNTGISTFTGLVTHNSTRRWVSTSVTTPANMIFTAGFTNTAGTFSAGGATVGDNQTLTGTVNMSFSRGITVLGNGDINIAGTATTGVTFGGTLINYNVRNLTVTGLLTVSTSGNLSVTGTTTLSGSGAFLDNNGTGNTTFNGLVTVGNTSTFTATSVTTIGRLVFAGGITQNNTTALAFNCGTIRTSATQTWSGAGDIRSAGVLDVNAGTLSNNLTGTVISVGTLTGTTFVQGINARLSLGSTTPLSIATLTSTASGNTVTYNSASATLRSQTYHHLIIAGSGTKTISTTDITVNGNLTISAGVLSNTTNNRTIYLAGNWINNVGAGGFAAGTGTGTVVLNGSSVQNIGGTSTTTFRNLTINNASGITQSMSSTINAVLTLTSGIITTGSTTIIISSTGSVSRTNGHINGNEQRNISTGSNVARTYDIGDPTNYTPVTLTFASVSIAGNVIVKTTATEHPLIVSVYLNSALSINRYWTLSNTGTTFTTYSGVFNFLSADKDASTNTANLIAGRNAGSWTYPTVGTKTSTSTQITGLAAFGDIAFAEQLPCTTPTLIITDPPAFCSPSTANLTAPAVTAGSTSGLVYTYWRDASATISLSSPAAVAVGGVYYIKGTVALGGCADVQPVTVTRNNPTGMLSGTTTICSGASTSLNISVTGTGPWSGTLSNGTSFSGSSNPLTVTVNPVSTTTYTISTLVDAACSAQTGDLTGSAVVTVSALPTTANAGPDQSICDVSATLAANTPIVGTGSWNIISGSGGSIVSPSSPSSAFTGTAGSTYVLRWSIDNAPCAASTDDVTIAFLSGVWTGATNTDWNNSGNWCNGIVPSGIVDVVLTAGLPNYPAITDNITINDITIATGASISITNSGTLAIKGNYSNTGTLSNNGLIVLNGSVQQNFPGSSATITQMQDLEVDNAAGVIIDKSFTIVGTLTPTSGVIELTDKIITLASSASGTARVAPVGGSFDYSGGGKFIVQRYVIAKRAWRLFTAPVTNSNTIFDSWQNEGVYTPNVGTSITGPAGAAVGFDAPTGASLKEWDVSSQALVNSNSTLTNISPGTSGSGDNSGYFIFIRGDRSAANFTMPNTNVTTLSSAGQLQTGPQTFAATSTAGKFTLIGNPYASPIDFNNISRTNILKRFVVWDPAVNTVGAYVTLDDIDGDGVFSSSVGGSSQTSELLSHQAFFVETAATGAASLTINESDKTDGSSYLLSRPAASSAKSLAISLYLVNADNSTVLADGAKAEFDDRFNQEVTAEDAIKFVNINETISLARNSSNLALERRPVPFAADTLYLSITKTAQRNYQLVLKPANLDDVSGAAFVKDSYLGTETAISLNDNTTLSFTVNGEPASMAANRFIIVFRPLGTLPVRFTSISAYKQQQHIAVEWKVENELGIEKYELEKSSNGRSFALVNTIDVTTLNNSTAQYNWLDRNIVSSGNFYRVKSIDRNGQITYSTVVQVSGADGKNGITVSPNPIQNNVINLQLRNQASGNYTVRLIDNNGQVIYQTSIKVMGNNVSQAVSVPKIIAKGIYQVEVKGPSNKRMLQQVMVE